jgi:ATPase, P-type (transporting), HAD superfamily, subfamily IC
MTAMNINWKGLSKDQVLKRQKEYGKNTLAEQKKVPFILKIVKILIEPMFLLLIVSSVIYFILGNPKDGALMLVFVIGIICVDIIQEWKTDKTLNALKDLSAPRATVIRNGEKVTIASEDIVPGDLMWVEEGMKIPADGFVLKANDLRVNESSLTGEAVAVWKHIARQREKSQADYWRDDYVYTGTLVTTGSGMILIDRTGSATEYGKIGRHLSEAVPEKTPLQKQTNRLVKICSLIAVILFILVSALTYFQAAAQTVSQRIIDSVLAGVTLAMAMIPEEFPVILTVFLSLGAWRLARKKSLIRHLPSVETMGAVSVLCVDKTGTITENKMRVTNVYTVADSKEHLVRVMGMASETNAYDPMEIAMIDYAASKGITRQELFSGELLREYPFTDELKMMGHVWKNGSTITIAAKGSPESILALTTLTDREKDSVYKEIKKMSSQGLRVIGVASANVASAADVPENITENKLTFEGLIGLTDPPREGIRDSIDQCERAGIRVIMITGDNGLTAGAIAERAGINNHSQFITGKQIDTMSDDELKKEVRTVNIFSRVTPEHKMRIVKALKAAGEVVAMTGDGVNDAPALKFADIGIAMGKRGSEVSREAADMILLDDHFGTIVSTIKDGRRIYDNIRKAIGYVFVIHIPIALSALAGPMLGIPQAGLFLLPVQVVLLELVIDPTCSIVLERQPAEKDTMIRKPRRKMESILDRSLFTKSIIQGLIIFASSFGAYYYLLRGLSQTGEMARTMGMAVLIFANLFLVLVNSSRNALAYKSLLIYLEDKSDKQVWIILGATVLILMVLIYSPVNTFFSLAPLPLPWLLAAVLIAFAGTFWYEPVKVIKSRIMNQ